MVDGPKQKRNRRNGNPDGSWKEPATESTGESVGLDKDRLEYLVDSQMQRIAGLQAQLERVRDWSSSSNGEANVALSSLVRIVSDSTASTRQRIKAAGAVLGYKVQDEGVVEFTKRFLESVCESADISNVDYKIEASELLRRHEAPRVAPETVRPAYRDDTVDLEPPEPLMELVARRRARQERMEREREMAQQAADLSDAVELPPQVE